MRPCYYPLKDLLLLLYLWLTKHMHLPSTNQASILLQQTHTYAHIFHLYKRGLPPSPTTTSSSQRRAHWHCTRTKCLFRYTSIFLGDVARCHHRMHTRPVWLVMFILHMHVCLSVDTYTYGHASISYSRVTFFRHHGRNMVARTEPYFRASVVSVPGLRVCMCGRCRDRMCRKKGRGSIGVINGYMI